jgi:hypothetical protein
MNPNDHDAQSPRALRSALACARALIDELESASGVDGQTAAPSWLAAQVADELARVARMIKLSPPTLGGSR